MGRSRNKDEYKEESTEDWLLTYGDLMTQLLCFFVLITAFSSVNAAKFQEVIISLQTALGGGAKGVLPALPSAIQDLPRSSRQNIDEDKLIELKSKIDEYIEKRHLSEHLGTEIRKEGLVITLKQKESSVFFDTASARIKREAYPVLNEIGRLIKNLSNDIRIEGHTDIRPINTWEFPSNWELSTTRATNVLRYLHAVSGIAPQRLSAVGYGPYRPIADNSTEAGMSKNRRVEIIVLRSQTYEEPSKMPYLRKER